MSQGRVIVIAAKRESGKTTLGQRIANSIRMPKMVSDIQGDWDVEYIDPLDLLDMCLEDEGKVYVFEDTTAAIPTGVLTKKFRAAIARCRRKRIVLIFMFHGLEFLPDDMFKMGIDDLFILKSNDDEDVIRKKWKRYPHIVDAFLRMKAKPVEPIFEADGVTKRKFPAGYVPTQFRYEYLKKP